MKKKFGIGSLSLVLFILAILWSINTKVLNDFCLGDVVLKSINIPTWSNGNVGVHNTVFYSFIFIVPGIILGCKFPNHRFAKSGKVSSTILACILIIFLIVFRI